MNFLNVSIVAALALSCFACGSAAPTVKVRYLPTTTSEVQIFAKEQDHRVKFVEQTCDGDTGTGTWLPAGHENETNPSTMDDAYAWMIANTSPGSTITSIIITEVCSDTTNIAAAGTVLPHPINPVALAADSKR